MSSIIDMQIRRVLMKKKTYTINGFDLRTKCKKVRAGDVGKKTKNYNKTEGIIYI